MKLKRIQLSALPYLQDLPLSVVIVPANIVIQ